MEYQNFYLTKLQCNEWYDTFNDKHQKTFP